ncbi:MAG: hypothetical protein WA553_14530 [Methylocella sp.]
MGLAMAKRPPRSPAREGLAVAIARHAEATRNIEASEAAYEASRVAWHDADAAVEAARVTLKEAPDAEAAYLVAKARGETPDEAPVTPRQARLNLQQAIETFDAAVVARESLDLHRKQASSSAFIATMNLDDRVQDAVRDDTDVHALVNEYRKILCDLENRRATLGFLGLSFSGLPDDFVRTIDPRATAFQKALESDADAVF